MINQAALSLMNIEAYMLSDQSRVENISRRLTAALVHNSKTSCLEWTMKSRANGGYGVLCVGRRGRIRAHRAAWVLARGPIPIGMYVCHRCDNPACCNLEHLFLGTPKDNMLDKEKKGRGVKPPVHRGEKHHNAKIPDSKLAEIKASDLTLESLSERFGVSTKTIWRIKKGISRYATG